MTTKPPFYNRFQPSQVMITPTICFVIFDQVQADGQAGQGRAKAGLVQQVRCQRPQPSGHRRRAAGAGAEVQRHDAGHPGLASRRRRTRHNGQPEDLLHPLQRPLRGSALVTLTWNKEIT